MRQVVAYILGGVVLAGSVSCAPDYAGVRNKLRADLSTRDREVKTLQDRVATLEATNKGLEAQLAEKSPHIQTLPPERLADLFTTASVDIQKQTDSSDLGEAGGGLKGFRVYIRTLTADHMVIPATGNLTIEAFELPAAPSEPVRIGSWTFTPADMKKNWYSGLGLNHFAFNCPWSRPPRQRDIVFKATFTDALTGVSFDAHLDKKISLP